MRTLIAFLVICILFSGCSIFEDKNMPTKEEALAFVELMDDFVELFGGVPPSAQVYYDVCLVVLRGILNRETVGPAVASPHDLEKKWVEFNK